MKYKDYLEFDNLLPEIYLNKVVDETTKEGIQEYYDLLMEKYKNAFLGINDNDNDNNCNCKDNDNNGLKSEVICKVTNFCNQRCAYCFDKNNQKKSRTVLSKEKIMKLLKLLNKGGIKNVEWIWHGGECLSVDKKWFDDVCFEMWKYAEQEKINLEFNAQTNGTLLDNEWIEILSKYNISIGTSYDWSGQEMRGYELSLDALSNFFFIISVVDKKNIKNLIKDFESAKELGIPFSFNFVFGNNEHSVDDFLNIDELIIEYKKYLDFFLSYNDPKISERSALSLINRAINRPAQVCNLGNCLLSYRICINSDGEMYKCDDTNIQQMHICSIDDIKDIDEFFYNTQINKLKEIKDNQVKNYCAECDLLTVCGQGCFNCTFRESNGEKPYSVYCKFFKEIAPYLYEKIGNLQPDEFVQLNPMVKQQLIEHLYLPAYLKEELQKLYYEHNNIQTNL